MKRQYSANPVVRGVLALGVLLPVSACNTDNLLKVEDPAFASPTSLAGAPGLPTLVAGALGDFQVAYSGAGDDSYLSVSSLLSDELHSSDTFTTRTATDQRTQFPTVQGNTSDAAYNRLQYARRSTGEAADAVAQFASTGKADPRYSQMRALEGFAITALSEGWCGAVPISASANSAPGEPGTPLTTTQLLDEALKRFNDALAASATNNGAKVGKARALLNQGKFAEAAAAVSGVPTTFVQFIEHSSNTGREYNPLFSLQANGRYTLSDREGGNGQPFRSAADPRVPWTKDPKGGFDNSIALFIDNRYPDFGSDVVLADGIEARLIEAEAALQANDIAGWLTKLNDLRSQVRSLMSARYTGYASRVPGTNNPTQTLDPLTDPGTASSRVDLMFRERAFWLLDTGHRLGDLRRLLRAPYSRPQNTVYPTGAYHKGGNYGIDVTFPIPFNESQNPNYKIEQCDVTKG